MPVADETVATDGDPEAHAPPGVAFMNVTLPATHPPDGPVIAAGNAFTVIATVRLQPVARV